MNKRNRYNYEFRLRCVEAVIKGNHSVRTVAKENGIGHSNLRLWLRFYRAYGNSGLRSRKKRHYDTAFKLEVLAAINKEFLSLHSACVRFNIPSDSLIVSWRNAYESKGELGLIGKLKSRPKKMKQPIKRKPRKSAKPLTREEELLLENQRLKAENELLKKLHALVQTSKKQKP